MPALLKYHQSLKALGIKTWTVNRSHVFLGEVSISLESNTKLILLTEEPLDKDLPFINDILTSMRLTHGNLAIIPLNKISHLFTSLKNTPLKRLVLLFKKTRDLELDKDIEEMAEDNELNMKIQQIKALKQCHLVELECLETLYASISLKRKLWKQINQYVND